MRGVGRSIRIEGFLSAAPIGGSGSNNRGEFGGANDKVEPHLLAESEHVLFGGDDGGNATSATEDSSMFDPRFQKFVPGVFSDIINNADNQLSGGIVNANQKRVVHDAVVREK